MALNMVVTLSPDGHNLFIDFPCVLHKRGTDFKVYRNSWDSGEFEFVSDDTELFKALIAGLIGNDESGVQEMHVKSYDITLTVSKAVPATDVVTRIDRIVRSLQKTPAIRWI